MIQEPLVRGGRVVGLPSHFRVFLDSSGGAAVVINDPCLDAHIVRTDNRGICVEVVGVFGCLWVTSLYCKHSEPLEPFLGFMETVLLLANNTPVIFGLDANAASTMWFSKISRQSSGYENYIRGELLGDFVVANTLHVLNNPSLWYTFAGPNGSSDIDVTLANDTAARRFSFEWRVAGGKSVSDHNLIEIVMTCTPNPITLEHGF